MNSWPASTLRLSVHTAENATSAPATLAPSAWAAVLSNSGLSMGNLPGLQGPGGLSQIGEGMAHAGDLLIILVSLASQHYHIANLSAGNQTSDRLATPRNELDQICAGETATNIGQDRRRVFAARIVVGHQHHVGQTLGALCHQRTLATVTITATAEQAQQTTGHMRAQSIQHLLQGIRGVGVVHHHQRQLLTTEALHAPDRPLQQRQYRK